MLIDFSKQPERAEPVEARLFPLHSLYSQFRTLHVFQKTVPFYWLEKEILEAGHSSPGRWTGEKKSASMKYKTNIFV